MTAIKVLCLECNQSFEFSHPAAQTADRLQHVTIDCTNCGTILKSATYHIVMEGLHTQMRRQLAPVLGDKAADAAEILVIDLVTNEDEALNPRLRLVDDAKTYPMEDLPDETFDAYIRLRKVLEA